MAGMLRESAEDGGEIGRRQRRRVGGGHFWWREMYVWLCKLLEL